MKDKAQMEADACTAITHAIPFVTEYMRQAYCLRPLIGDSWVKEYEFLMQDERWVEAIMLGRLSNGGAYE